MRTSSRHSSSLGISLFSQRVVRCAVVTVSVAAIAACGRPQSPAAATGRAQSTIALKGEAEIRDLDIEYFQARARRDPTGAMDLAHVGALYLARGRESGDPRDAILAEDAARKSLHNRSVSNVGASQVLQSALLAQHRFVEALTLALVARDEAPENPTLRAAVGDIQMELGQYDSARVSFANLHTTLGDLNVAPRLARWAEIEGQPDKARRMLHAALVNALRTNGVPNEQRAWYWLRVGDVEMRTGHMHAADSAYTAGLTVHPDDYRLLSALAHSAALQRDWKRAIAYGERVIGLTLDPATLGTLSDAYAATGDSAKSAEYAHVLDVAVLKQPGAYHRAWSLFLLDHNRHLPVVAHKIREELRTRTDVYAYDLLAWSLHKQGRDADAEHAMQKALREGTQDAQLFFHAGVIAQALGHVDVARDRLTRALAVNPAFHPTQPSEARAILASLPMTVAAAPARMTRP
ncbi:MAG: hypothetical protein ABJE47_09820 [bacterium]